MERKHLILLPGLLGKFETWDYLSEEIKERYQIHYYDFPDYALSPKSGYTLNDFTQAVLDYINLNELDDFIIAGHSIGGAVAINVAYLCKKNISGLVLISSAGLPLSVNKLEGIIIRGTGIENFHKLGETLFYDASVKDRLHVEGAYKSFSMDKKRRLKGFIKTVRNIKNVDLSSILQKINIPSIIIWGEEDGITPISHAEKIHNYLHKSKLFVLSECGHVPQLEKSDEFNQILLNFSE